MSNTESTLDITSYIGALTRFTATPSAESAVQQLNNMEDEIERLLGQLSSQISGMTNKSAVIAQQMPLAEDVQIGHLVYWDSSDAVFKKALAGLLGVPGTQGQSLETPASRVCGMVIERYVNDGADTSNVVGTLLVGGMWNSASAASACLGSVAAAPGTYYLSPTTPGMATLDPGYHLRQPVLTYMGEGQISMSLFFMAHDNHWHGSLKLDSACWKAWTTVNPDPDQPPTPPRNPPDSESGTPMDSEPWMWYDASADYNAKDLGDLTRRTTAVFQDGVLVVSDDAYAATGFYLDYGVLWYRGQEAPSGLITVFNHFPFAYGSAVVRDIESGNDALTLYKRNGLIRLTMNDFVTGTSVRTPYAISGISGRTLSRTPVITGLNAGPGTSISLASNGVATISAKSAVGYPMDAYNVNVNGATVTSDGQWTYFMFPKGRANAGLIINMPVTGLDSGMTLSGSVWGWGYNATATFNVELFFLPDPPANGSTVPPQAGVQGTISFSGDNIRYAQSSNSVEIGGNGLLYARITVNGAPDEDVRLMRIGFILTVVSGVPAEAPAPVAEGATQVGYATTAGESLEKFQCVRVGGNGLLYKCRSTNQTDMAGYVGITTEAAAAGATCNYVSQGTIDGLNGLPAGRQMFCGTDGKPTMQTPLNQPGATFHMQVGIALSSTTFLVIPTPGTLFSETL